MAAEFCNLRLRNLISAKYEARDLAGDQLVIHRNPALSGKSGEICDLHISDHLHALVVKMRVKSGELKRRTIDIRVGNDDLFGIQLRCQVFEIHFFY